MKVTDFIAQAHPSTLDWLEDALLPQLMEVDKLYRAQETLKQVRQLCALDYE